MFVLVHLERVKPQNFQWRRAFRSKIKGHTFYRLLSGTLIYSIFAYPKKNNNKKQNFSNPICFLGNGKFFDDGILR